MRKGFTLVELSIVLVIIGLLIGGILVAQSMISASRLTAQVSQFQQFDAAVANFQTKYKYLPGDAPVFGGDGDGLITMGANEGWQNSVNSYAGEIANVWNNLFLEDYAPSPTPSVGSIPVLKGPGKNVPEAKLGIAGSYVIASAIGDTMTGVADLVNPRHFYAIIPPTTIPTAVTHCCYQLIPITTAASSAQTPAETLSLDKKMDDGIADSGSLQSGNLTLEGDGSAYITISPLATCSNGPNYLVSTATRDCTPLIRMGTMTGDLK